MDTLEAAQRIAAAVAPAVMVSACGLLALGLDNQAARMTGRLRELAKECRALSPGHPRAAAVRAQTLILAQRHRLYTVALMCNYGALLAFVLTSVTALWSHVTLHALSLVFFTLGVILLASMTVSALLSVRLSRRAIVVEEQEVLSGEAPRDSHPAALAWHRRPRRFRDRRRSAGNGR